MNQQLKFTEPLNFSKKSYLSQVKFYLFSKKYLQMTKKSRNDANRYLCHTFIEQPQHQQQHQPQNQRQHQPLLQLRFHVIILFLLFLLF